MSRSFPSNTFEHLFSNFTQWPTFQTAEPVLTHLCRYPESQAFITPKEIEWVKNVMAKGVTGGAQ